jgi:DNA-directed RNA polymerase beta' subunit
MEMNMHVPQSEQSRIELRELAAVPTQIISPSTHKPIISIVQDTLVGSYLFTRYDNYLTREEVLDVMIDVSTFDGTLPEPEVKAGTKDKDLPVDFPKYKYNTKVDLWSGRQLFSMIIPPINLNKKNSSYDNDSREINNVVIKNGKVISGVFDNIILGQSEGSLIHIVFHKYGFERTQQLLDDIQNIVTNWVLKSGFSVGIGDLIPDKNTENKIKDIIDINKKKVIEIISHVHQNILENKTGKSNNEEFEQQVKKELQELTDLTGKIAVKNLRSDNRMMSMIVSGSKGKALNISQMMACVGQQDVDSKRIQYGFTDRTLPHFHKFDDGASARGFVENSFMKGLTPTEFFFHAMGGREGLIDTAVKTSETGYIQRKLVKCMEDARVATDYTVRNANGTIIQFLYGEDGFDGTKIEKQTITTVNLSNAQIYDKFKLDIDEDINNKYIPDIADDILKNKDIIDQQIQKHIDKLLIDRDFYFNDIFKGNFNENTVFAPVNLNRLVDDAISNFPLHTNLSDLHPSYILNKLIDLDENLKITDSHKGNEIIMVLANIYLSPKPLLNKKISKIAFDYVIAYLTQMFYAAIAHPGELVGTVSAQSMGEPTTQMTLNSVDWDTEIIIAKNGNIITPKIGEFIDNYYENIDKSKVSFMENDQIYIPLEDGADYKALSTDEDGNIKWTKLEAITRHPVINKDGTDTILQVTLESGRVIKATKAKSFLTKFDNKILGIDGDKLKIGDLIPVLSSIGNIENNDEFKNIYINSIKDLVNNEIFNEVYWDPIESIKEIKPMEKWVYDLTVEETRNFTVSSGVALIDTFHTAGSGSKGTQGVPRIKELLSVTSNMKKPMNKIILKEPYCYNKEYSLKIMNELSITTIKNLTISSEIYFDTQTIISDSSELPEDKAILDIYKVFNELDTPIANSMVKSPWVLRFKLDKMKLLEKGLRMSDIYFAIISRFNTDNQDISCIFSDDNSTNLILRIQCITDKVEEADCDQEDMICILKTLEKTILNDIVLNGIKGIESAYPIPDDNFSKFDNDTKEFVKKRRWTIETDGSNLEDIFAHPAIDAYNSYSNNINEIFEVLGLEAARQALFEEIYNTFLGASSYVNTRHINLLVDIMTNRGYLMSVDRHGINKGDRGPLAKCSFEETPDIINRAAIFGELDKLKSVSSNIMLGQEVPIGTGSIDLLFDEERYFETLATIQEETDTSNLENIEEFGEKESFTSKYCEALF